MAHADADRAAIDRADCADRAGALSAAGRCRVMIGRKAYGPQNVQFATHISLYGNCAVTYRDDTKVTGKPIRLFHGTADDIELIALCRAYVARPKRAGADVTLTEYAGAQHGFVWFMFKEPMKLSAARSIVCMPRVSSVCFGGGRAYGRLWPVVNLQE